jgi:ubiquinone/menaquinone biosynthesis C-methylase UbiE
MRSGTLPFAVTRDPKTIVAAGYDRISRSYLRLVDSGGPAVRQKYLRIIRERVPAGARILELGCGAGAPMTRTLSAAYDVVALDISPNQLALARANAPAARLLRADMTRLPFAHASMDAVAAFYSTTHVPRAEHRSLLAEIRRVLRPRALVVLTTGFSDTPGYVDPDWLGAPMFFSHYDGDTNVALVRDAGFSIVSAQDELEYEFGVPVRFRWVVARHDG